MRKPLRMILLAAILLALSACGKSMTLKCIAGIEKPDRGRIVLDGETLFDSDKKINLPPLWWRVPKDRRPVEFPADAGAV